MTTTQFPASAGSTVENFFHDAQQAVASWRKEHPKVSVATLGPLPFEHIEYIARHLDASSAVIVPVLMPGEFTIQPQTMPVEGTRQQIDAIRDGDVVLADRLGITGMPVHSIGSVRVSSAKDATARTRSGEQRIEYSVEQQTGVGSFGTFPTIEKATAAAEALTAENPYLTLFVRGHIVIDGTRDLASITASRVFAEVDVAVAVHSDTARIANYFVVQGTR